MRAICQLMLVGHNSLNVTAFIQMLAVFNDRFDFFHCLSPDLVIAVVGLAITGNASKGLAMRRPPSYLTPKLTLRLWLEGHRPQQFSM